MKRRFEIGWTYGGYTAIDAESKADARRLFEQNFDLTEHVRGNCDAVEITDVSAVNAA